MIWSTRPTTQSRYSLPVRTFAVGKPARAWSTSAFACATAASPSSRSEMRKLNGSRAAEMREELVGVDDDALQDRRIAVAADGAERRACARWASAR